MLRYTPKNADLPSSTDSDDDEVDFRPGAYSIENGRPIRRQPESNSSSAFEYNEENASSIFMSSIPPELRTAEMMASEMDNIAPEMSPPNDDNGNANANNSSATPPESRGTPSSAVQGPSPPEGNDEGGAGAGASGQENETQDKQTTKRRIYLIVAVVALIIVAAAVTLSLLMSNSKDSSSVDVRLNAFKDVLYEISGETLDDKDTYQHEALLWLVDDDGLDLPIPETQAEKDTLIERYIFAAFYFGAWPNKAAWLETLNFLSPDSVCNWNKNETLDDDGRLQGVVCDDVGVPTSLSVGTFDKQRNPFPL